MIDKYGLGQVFKEKDTTVINNMTGWNFRAYKRIKNPTWPTDTRCLAHTEDGNTWEVWSWNKAIDNYGSFPNMLEAMRLSIQPQMREFAQTAPNKCMLCASEDTLSVDHKDKPFITMVRDFLKDHPGMTDAVQNDASGAGWFIADETIKETWVLYHKVNATYQILCKSCNSKKGARS